MAFDDGCTGPATDSPQLGFARSVRNKSRHFGAPSRVRHSFAPFADEPLGYSPFLQHAVDLHLSLLFELAPLSATRQRLCLKALNGR